MCCIYSSVLSPTPHFVYQVSLYHHRSWVTFSWVTLIHIHVLQLALVYEVCEGSVSHITTHIYSHHTRRCYEGSVSPATYIINTIIHWYTPTHNFISRHHRVIYSAHTYAQNTSSYIQHSCMKCIEGQRIFIHIIYIAFIIHTRSRHEGSVSHVVRHGSNNNTARITTVIIVIIMTSMMKY